MDGKETGAGAGAPAAWQARAWRRLLAGLLVEQGLGDKAAAKTWQERVKSGDFDPDLCAEQLLAGVDLDAAKVESQLLVRAARLERDLLMTPLLRGVSGASRKVRGAAKSGAAALVTQVIVVLTITVLAFLMLLVLAFRGVEFDPFFQAIIDWIPALPDSQA